MALTEAQQIARAGKVTASFLPALMMANQDRILEEWRLLVGDPDYAPPDFSDNWAVQLGSYLEPFILNWHQERTGQPMERRGEFVGHPDLPHVGCTLDAWRQADNTVIDCKVVGQWRKLPEVIAYYTPQMVIQKACVGADAAALLIVHGGAEPAEHPVIWDDEYEAEVWSRIAWFWDCVTFLRPPFALEPVIAATPAIREQDMTGSNAWSDAATTWRAHRSAAKLFSSAEKELKILVPADVRRAFGNGIEIVRDKASRLSVKEIAT